MRKFLIAGLLIFVVFISGVFADPTDSFEVYTTIAGKNLIKVVASDSEAPTTYQEFNSLVVNETGVEVTTIGSPVDVKKLAYFSNQKFTATMTVAPMAGTGSNSYKIHYSATCAGPSKHLST